MNNQLRLAIHQKKNLCTFTFDLDDDSSKHSHGKHIPKVDSIKICSFFF